MGNIKSEKGFTLAEALIVLAVVFLVISLSFILLKRHDQYVARHLFFSQLQADFIYAQHYALTNQTPVFVNLVGINHTYYFTKKNGEHLIAREFDRNISLSEGTQKLYFYINSSGHLNSFGSIYISIGDERYRLTFLIGRGRFYVVKI